MKNESKDIEPDKLNPWSILAGNVNRSYAVKNGKKQTGQSVAKAVKDLQRRNRMEYLQNNKDNMQKMGHYDPARCIQPN